jgi:hypothetical protein
MRLILTYLILVGIPIVLILGVLQLGSHLEAPASVGGTWVVSPTPQDNESKECEALLVPGGLMQWIILQSGPWLEIRVTGNSQISLEGELSGTTITANSDDPDKRSLSIQVQAVVDRNAEPDRLEGTILTNYCSQPVVIKGVRSSSQASVKN